MSKQANHLHGEQVSTLLEAVGAAATGRVPLEVTLAALAEEREDPRLATVARQLVSELERGVPIEQAVARLEQQLPAEVRGLLRAGIESGDLAGTMTRFTDQRLMTRRIVQRIRTTIAYPLLISLILVPLMLFIGMYVIPMFEDLFNEFDLVLPGITLLVLETGKQLPGMISGLVLFVIGVPVVLRLFGGRWIFHRARSAIPFIGPLWMWCSQREFAAQLASFLDLRLPMTSAVAHTGEVLSDRNLARACRRVSQRLETGQSLSACLSQSIHFDRSFVAMVTWGERHGVLPEALRIATELFDDRIEQHASLIQRLLPPVTLIVVGAMALAVIIGLMVPLVMLIQALSL
jgi:type II secretory pathway component PulF